MSPRLVIVVAALVGLSGCGYDGPSSGVRVAAPVSVDDDDVDSVDGSVGGGGRSAGAIVATDGASVEQSPTEGVADGAVEVAPERLPASVAVVGDSLTLSAAAEIEESLLELGLEVVAIDGVESRRMTRGGSALPSGTSAIDDIVEAGELPELWVVALGTNDVGAQVESSAFADDVAAVIRRIPAGVPVIWVDIWIRDRAEAAVDANRAIRSVLAMRPGSFVVDWHSYGEIPDTITGDGVHLTEIGQVRFADAIADAVVTLAAE